MDMKHLLKEVRILTREKRRESNTSEDRRLSLASRLKIILPMLIENFVKRTNADHDQYFDDRIVLAAVELFLGMSWLRLTKARNDFSKLLDKRYVRVVLNMY